MFFCIQSLMRFYEDSASMSVTAEKSSHSLFRFWRDGNERDGCDLVFEVVSDDLLLGHRRDLLEEIERQGYQPAIMSGGDNAGACASIFVKFPVADVWEPGAADQAAGLATGLLDAAGVDRETRLNLSVRGRKSMNGLREARVRQKQGDDQAFPSFIQEEDEPELQRRVREKLASWLLPK